MQLHLLEQKEKAETQLSFIGDRTTVDAFVYALYWLGREDDLQRPLFHYMQRCMTHAAQTYDLIFLFPWGAIPLEDDGVRSAKEMYQFNIQMMIEHMVFQVSDYLPVHIVQSTTLADRTKEILEIVTQVEAEEMKEAVVH